MKIGKFIPSPLKPPLKKITDFIIAVSHRGNNRYCPVCKKSSRKFGEFGVIPRNDARCIHCGALERHRLTWLYFKRKTDLFNRRPIKMLHVAPEPVFEKLLRCHLGPAYITADLYNPRAMIKMDITDIQYPDESFNVIYCSHVLEHVSDDIQAMREFFRTLKSDGWAILLVPITADRTFEDPSITNPTDRMKLFDQEDHVRRYGSDYVERLREAGFEVKVTIPSDFLSREEIIHMGITKEAGEIYYCTK